MARQCAVEGCKRTTDPGWARCNDHLEAWLDRLLTPVTREATKAADYELPRWKPSEAELRVLDGNR